MRRYDPADAFEASAKIIESIDFERIKQQNLLNEITCLEREGSRLEEMNRNLFQQVKVDVVSANVDVGADVVVSAAVGKYLSVESVHQGELLILTR